LSFLIKGFNFFAFLKINDLSNADCNLIIIGRVLFYQKTEFYAGEVNGYQ